jgi:hypothetical protein
MVVTLVDGEGRVETVSVAEVVLETFIGPRPSPDHIPRHKDGNFRNCVAKNLEWSLPQQWTVPSPSRSDLLRSTAPIGAHLDVIEARLDALSFRIDKTEER